MVERLPDFLVIGAMKAGTTTLYADLAAQPSVFMSPVKEPDDLLDPGVETDSGRKRYAKLFDGAQPHQRCGEASTSYSKLPEFDGVAARAKRVLGGDTKIVYLVRNPVDRIISHHFHMISRHNFDRDINNVVRSDNRLLDFSRYDMQLKPWLQHFGADAVNLLRFEDFVQRRTDTFVQLCRFLGFDANVELLDNSAKHNASNEQIAYPGITARFIGSQFYMRIVSPMLSSGTKEALRRWLGRGTPKRPAPPSPSTLDYLISELQPSVEELSRMLGLNAPLWDLEETRSQYTNSIGPAKVHDRS